jgi:FdhD protein
MGYPSGPEFAYQSCQGNSVMPGRKQMTTEALCTIEVNGQSWVTLLCSPHDLDHLALGFLFDAGVIESAAEVRDIRVIGGFKELETLVQVDLRCQRASLPSNPTLTSGCSGGVTFFDIAAKRSPLISNLKVRPEQIYDAMEQLMLEQAQLHREVGGFHTAALSDGHSLLIVAHDVGRHNTLDKVAGAALIRGIPTRDRLLVATGRISTEMLAKAARMKVPIIISRNSPTGLATHLAREWRIMIAGYVRGQKMHVYSTEDRIAPQEPTYPRERPEDIGHHGYSPRRRHKPAFRA